MLWSHDDRYIASKNGLLLLIFNYQRQYA